MSILDQQTLTMIFQIFLAAFLGMLIGFEREQMGKPAGVRTYMLVSMGAALFTLLSIYGFPGIDSKNAGYDPSRIASQVVVGIGFLGAGIIFFTKTEVRGLTTAAAVWVSAAIGMSVALKFYWVGAFTTLLTLLILRAVRFIEDRIGPKREK